MRTNLLTELAGIVLHIFEGNFPLNEVKWENIM
jgi:hypothetical protein